MSDITVTSAQVSLQKGANTRSYDAGASCTVGYAGYIDSDGDVQHSQSDTTEEAARGVGIIVGSYDGETSITSGNRLSLCTFGEVNGFSGMTPGAPVYVSANAGRITHTAPTSGYARALGYAKTATTLFVNPESGDPSSS
jgi:hypothetical protein